MRELLISMSKDERNLQAVDQVEHTPRSPKQDVGSQGNPEWVLGDGEIMKQ
jgi:hypothetical protein